MAPPPTQFSCSTCRMTFDTKQKCIDHGKSQECQEVEGGEKSANVNINVRSQDESEIPRAGEEISVDVERMDSCHQAKGRKSWLVKK